MTITVKLIHPFGYFQHRCRTCWHAFEPRREVAGELHEDGERVGLICDECLDAGEDGLKARMEKCADYLSDCAKGLRESAAGKVVVPTSAEIARRDEEERAAWAEAHAKDEAEWACLTRTTAPDNLSDDLPF